jgi:tryptophan synthase alpha chain
MKFIRQTILDKGKNLLNVYFTAGHPSLESTVEIIKALSEMGVDLIEVGMPYSDPLADGQTIQASSQIALENGQSLDNIFKDIRQCRQFTDTPIILMGYYNQLLQFGVEKFVREAHSAGVQGLIIPDLPMSIYEAKYKSIFESVGMEISFLITPLTSNARIEMADRLSSGFLYVVSQSSITGKTTGFSEDQIKYFERIKSMQLNSPTLLGFGIYDKKTREIANTYFHGSIIGSAFIRCLDNNSPYDAVQSLMHQLNQ